MFLFFGDDVYSQREKLLFWNKEFEKKYGGDMNITTMNGSEVTANDIFQACSSVPFLSEKRLTVVKNFLSEGRDEERAGIIELLEKIPDFCVLIFSETNGVDKRIGLYKKLQKIATVKEFSPITGSALISWIDKKVHALGGSIERSAVLELAEIVTEDLFRVENELAKLVGYAGDRPITKADVELLVESQLNASIFKLTDGIGQKNERLALGTLHQLIEMGDELHHILYMIMRQFRIITCVKDLSAQGLSRDAIVKELKEHPFVISNTMLQARNFSFDQLKRAYELLIDLDLKTKNGGIKILAGDNREFVLAMDRLVLDLCK